VTDRIEFDLLAAARSDGLQGRNHGRRFRLTMIVYE
jgi:hypothetical protein